MLEQGNHAGAPIRYEQLALIEPEAWKFSYAYAMSCFKSALLMPPIVLSALTPRDRGVRRTARAKAKN